MSSQTERFPAGIGYVTGRLAVPLGNIGPNPTAGIVVDTNDSRLAAIGQAGAIPARVGAGAKAAFDGNMLWYREISPSYVNGASETKWVGPLYGIAPSSGAQIGVSLPAGKILEIGSWWPFVLDRNVGSWPTGPLG